MPYKQRERDPQLQAILDKIGLTELGRRIGVGKQVIYEWRQVPEHWVKAVSKATKKTRHYLRPDLFARSNGRRLRA